MTLCWNNCTHGKLTLRHFNLLIPLTVASGRPCTSVNPPLTSCQDWLLPVKPIYTVAELCSCLTSACQPLSSPFILFHPIMALLSTDTTLCPHPQSPSQFTLFRSDPSPVFAQAAASLTLFSHSSQAHPISVNADILIAPASPYFYCHIINHPVIMPIKICKVITDW